MNRNVVPIEDPHSLLHVINYKQNKDFERYVQVKTHDSKKILKINTPDSLTYFRLQHELSEAQRKQDQFNILRNDRINGLITQNLIDYDKKMMDKDSVNHYEIEEKIKQTKLYKRGLELGKLLKPDVIEEEEVDVDSKIGHRNLIALKSNVNEKTKGLMKSKTMKHL